MNKRTSVLATGIAGLAISLSACSSSGGAAGTASSSAMDHAAMQSSAMHSSGMHSSGMHSSAMGHSAMHGASSSTMGSGSAMGADTMSGQFGAGCSKVPTNSRNPGSFDAMAKVPVATAASGNPLLSTLVKAVGAANLVDTLNGANGITVFAPDNRAFAIAAKTLKKVLADRQTLTKILTYNVVGKQLSPAQLKGTIKTLEGGTVTVTGSRRNVSVNGAHVVCGNIKTANATVYIIDSVLMPKK